jgi:glycosyltransferase involved in cell wall biosynthesis
VISVVLPCLNEAATIEACLKSISRQSLKRECYEIVVVDGGSDDGTVEKAKRQADVVISQSSKGIGGARRDGANGASGEIFAFTDADTLVGPDWLSRINANLSEAGKDSSGGPVVYIDGDLRAELLSRWREVYRIFGLVDFNYMIGSNMAVTAKAYWRIGGHKDISLLDDYDLSLRLWKSKASSIYDPMQVVTTSSRRADRLLTYAILVAYGHYHYKITGDHSRLLNYPKPDEMTLSDLLPSKGKKMP